MWNLNPQYNKQFIFVNFNIMKSKIRHNNIAQYQTRFYTPLHIQQQIQECIKIHQLLDKIYNRTQKQLKKIQHVSLREHQLLKLKLMKVSYLPLNLPNIEYAQSKQQQMEIDYYHQKISLIKIHIKRLKQQHNNQSKQSVYSVQQQNFLKCIEELQKEYELEIRNIIKSQKQLNKILEDKTDMDRNLGQSEYYKQKIETEIIRLQKQERQYKENNSLKSKYYKLKDKFKFLSAEKEQQDTKYIHTWKKLNDNLQNIDNNLNQQESYITEVNKCLRDQDNILNHLKKQSNQLKTLRMKELVSRPNYRYIKTRDRHDILENDQQQQEYLKKLQMEQIENQVGEIKNHYRKNILKNDKLRQQYQNEIEDHERLNDKKIKNQISENMLKRNKNSFQNQSQNHSNQKTSSKLSQFRIFNSPKHLPKNNNNTLLLPNINKQNDTSNISKISNQKVQSPKIKTPNKHEKQSSVSSDNQQQSHESIFKPVQIKKNYKKKSEQEKIIQESESSDSNIFKPTKIKKNKLKPNIQIIYLQKHKNQAPKIIQTSPIVNLSKQIDKHYLKNKTQPNQKHIHSKQSKYQNSNSKVNIPEKYLNPVLSVKKYDQNFNDKKQQAKNESIQVSMSNSILSNILQTDNSGSSKTSKKQNSSSQQD